MASSQPSAQIIINGGHLWDIFLGFHMQSWARYCLQLVRTLICGVLLARNICIRRGCLNRTLVLSTTSWVYTEMIAWAPHNEHLEPRCRSVWKFCQLQLCGALVMIIQGTGLSLPWPRPIQRQLKHCQWCLRAPRSWHLRPLIGQFYPNTGLWLADVLRAGVSSTHLDNWIGHNCGGGHGPRVWEPFNPLFRLIMSFTVGQISIAYFSSQPLYLLTASKIWEWWSITY